MFKFPILNKVKCYKYLKVYTITTSIIGVIDGCQISDSRYRLNAIIMGAVLMPVVIPLSIIDKILN